MTGTQIRTTPVKHESSVCMIVIIQPPFTNPLESYPNVMLSTSATPDLIANKIRARTNWETGVSCDCTPIYHRINRLIRGRDCATLILEIYALKLIFEADKLSSLNRNFSPADSPLSPSTRVSDGASFAFKLDGQMAPVPLYRPKGVECCLL